MQVPTPRARSAQGPLLPLGESYADQKQKNRRRHTVTFTYIMGILSLSFIAAILINKYDACSIFSRKPRRSGRLTHARVQSHLHSAWQTQAVFGTQAFRVYVSFPPPPASYPPKIPPSSTSRSFE